MILAEQGILSSDSRDNLIGIANFRNILVHDYEKIDREIVYQKLQKNLDSFMVFKKDIARCLQTLQ